MFQLDDSGEVLARAKGVRQTASKLGLHVAD